jgi:hypothetical protein
MKRLLSALVAAAVISAAGFAAGATPARASDWWCWDDPVLVVENQVIHIYAGVPNKFRQRVVLADMVVTVPAGVDARITASNQPRFPQASRLVRAGNVGPDGAIHVTATLTVRGHGRFDVALKVRQPSGGEVIAYGESNEQFSTELTLAGKNPRHAAGRGS